MTKIVSIIIRVFSVLILFVMGIETNRDLFYFVLFTINRESLTEDYCEKRIASCKACCYLDKQYKENSEGNTPVVPERKTKENELNILEYLLFNSSYNHQTAFIEFLYLMCHDKYTLIFITDIFHPPRL